MLSKNKIQIINMVTSFESINDAFKTSQKEIGVSRRTFYTYLEQQEFKAEYERRLRKVETAKKDRISKKTLELHEKVLDSIIKELPTLSIQDKIRVLQTTGKNELIQSLENKRKVENLMRKIGQAKRRQTEKTITAKVIQ